MKPKDFTFKENPMINLPPSRFFQTQFISNIYGSVSVNIFFIWNNSCIVFKSWKIELFDWFLSCRLGKHLCDQLAYLHMKYKYTDDDMVKGYILEAFRKYFLLHLLTGYPQWYFSMKLVKKFFWIFLSCGNLLSVILYQNALKSSLLVYKWYKNHIMSFKVGLC